MMWRISSVVLTISFTTSVTMKYIPLVKSRAAVVFLPEMVSAGM